MKVYGASPDGAVTFRRAGTSDTCSSYGSNIAGRGVTLDVLVNGSEVGEVKYDHLDLTDIGSNPVPSGTQIGKVTGESLNSSCFQTRHAHVQFRNTSGNYSCYADHGNPGTTLAAADRLGVIGSTNSGPQQACASFPNSSPPPTPPPIVTNKFYLNDNWDAQHDVYTTYGDYGVGALAGDWNGDGKRTLGVRYGNKYYLNNGFDAGAEIVVTYGDANIPVLAGDWNGDGVDTLGIREGNTFYLNNSFDAGADIVASYGNSDMVAMVGDWNGNGVDTLGVRDGNTYYLNDTFDTTADLVMAYGDADDHSLVGDWNADGTDTLGIRQVDQP